MKSRLTRNAIPERFLKWLVTSRLRILNDLREGKPIKYFSAHLPVLATWDAQEPFPVNMTVKGIGLIPKRNLLQSYTDIFEGAFTNAINIPWSESFSNRTKAIDRLYGRMGDFDRTMLGGLEIFKGKAYENLRENPYASLLFVGMSPTSQGVQYISFQINGNVEILEKDNIYYRFLLASRKLFDFDKFHLHQSDYPWGYLIKVVEVRDKSPWVKRS